MVNACADPELFVREGGGGGVQAQRRENSLEFFYVCYCFFSSKFSGDAGGGVQLFTGGSKC